MAVLEGPNAISGFLVVIILTITSFLYVLKSWQENRKLPPGPRGLPIIGSALSIENKSYLTFGRWARTFGDIFTVNVFGQRMIIISEINLAREAYNNPALLGRAFVEPFEIYFRGNKEYPKEVAHGVLSSEGAQWIEQRRFTIRHLRDFGFGKQNYMEEHINAEASFLLEHLQAQTQKAKSVNLWRPFTHASSNILWRIVAGERIAQDEEQKRIMELAAEKVLEQLERPVSVFLPWISKSLGKLSGWSTFVNASTNMQNILNEHVTTHAKNFSAEKEPRDFMDAYLRKISDTSDVSSSFYGENGVDSLKLIATDLFIAGSETTSATLNWAVLYLTTWTEIQERLFEEISEVVGNSSVPSLQDRTKMPFTEAVINETLRKSSFSTFGVMHRAMADTELKGYTIPKDSWICVNQHYIHHDPKVWGDPENFRPERFLTTNSDGTISLKKYEELIPFSIGKRLCIGEQLAKDELFILLCTFYQKYSTEFDPDSPKPGLEPRTTMFKHSPPFKVVLHERNESVNT